MQPTQTSNGTQLYYEVWGAGTPLLLVSRRYHRWADVGRLKHTQPRLSPGLGVF